MKIYKGKLLLGGWPEFQITISNEVLGELIKQNVIAPSDVSKDLAAGHQEQQEDKAPIAKKKGRGKNWPKEDIMTIVEILMRQGDVSLARKEAKTVISQEGAEPKRKKYGIGNMVTMIRDYLFAEDENSGKRGLSKRVINILMEEGYKPGCLHGIEVKPKKEYLPSISRTNPQEA